MASDSSRQVRHRLDFTIYNLISTIVRIEFPEETGVELLMLSSLPTVRIGANYVESPIRISSLFMQPRRLQFEITDPPPLLPISLQLSCTGPFVTGQLLVPANVQTVVTTVAQTLRIVGPGYWALPLADGIAVGAATAERSGRARPAPAPAAPAPASAPAPAASPEAASEGATRTLDTVVRTARSGAPAPAATGRGGRESGASPS